MRLRGDRVRRERTAGVGRLRSGFTVNLTHELSWNIRKDSGGGQAQKWLHS